MRMARECIEEWGMKGFKLMPSAGFHPDDRSAGRSTNIALTVNCRSCSMPGDRGRMAVGAADVHLDRSREVSRREDDHGACRVRVVAAGHVGLPAHPEHVHGYFHLAVGIRHVPGEVLPVASGHCG